MAHSRPFCACSQCVKKVTKQSLVFVCVANIPHRCEVKSSVPLATQCVVSHFMLNCISRNLTLLCSLFPNLSVNYLVILHPVSVFGSHAISSMPLTSFDCSFWRYTVIVLTVKVFQLQDKPFSGSDNTFLYWRANI